MARFHQITLSTLLIATTLFITACGGDGGSTPPPSSDTLSGVAAVGYPIVGGSIQIMCVSGTPLNTTTDNTGIWQVTSTGQTLPCAIEVTGGTVNGVTNVQAYHSVATSFGTANVTTLSDLMLAYLLNEANPNIWFAGLDPATLTLITPTSVSDALTVQCTVLSALTPLCTTNPITSVFTATRDNIMDYMLIALSSAIINSGVAYSDLLIGAATPSYTLSVGFDTALADAYSATTSSISATANTTVQNLTEGTAITSFSPLLAIGGAKPYVYSITSGTLPAGLSFNTSTGVVSGTPSATYTTADLVFSVEDANNVVASTTSTVSFSVGAVSGGSLDTSFNLTGKALTSFGITNEIAKAVAIQTDGKIIAAGSVSGVITGTFALARYNIDGTLDTTFGTNGKVTTIIGANVSAANSVAIQSDGKIVAVGYWGDGGIQNIFAMARYNIDGSLDTTFGTDGKVAAASNLGVTQSVVIQADQMILVAGSTGLTRYSSNGSIDTTFGTNGVVTTAIGLGYFAASIVIQPDGKIITAGNYLLANGITRAFALVRYNATGSLDTTFDTDGIVTTAIGASFDSAYAVAIQTDNKIIAGGTSLASTTSSDLALVRYNSDGSLDASFGTDGIVTKDMGYGDSANGVAIQDDGKIVVAAGYNINGLALVTGVAGAPFSLVRYNADGSQDNTFGVAGTVTAGTGASQAVVIQADNKILAVGSLNNGTENDFGVVRLIP